MNESLKLYKKSRTVLTSKTVLPVVDLGGGASDARSLFVISWRMTFFAQVQNTSIKHVDYQEIQLQTTPETTVA